jgi:hypothetical protein
MKSIVHTDNIDWPWMIARDTVYRLKGFDPAFSYMMLGDDGKVYASIRFCHITLYEGYRFDGCTCAPDFCRALPGCAVHDALLQMLDMDPELFTEQLAHEQLYHTHKEHRFLLAKVYYWAVSGWPRKLYNQMRKQ